MNKRFVLVFGLLAGAMLAGPAHADEQTRALLTGYLEPLNDYRADFVQTVEDANGYVTEQSSGEFWLSRPDRFRWYYAPPLERVLVSDGTRIWLHDVDLDQVTVRNADGLLEQTPAGILVGNAAVLDDYEVSWLECLNNTCIALEPRSPQADFQTIVMIFAGDTLQELVLNDRFGTETRIRFSNVRVNKGNPDSLFRFEVPDGVDVIDQTGS